MKTTIELPDDLAEEIQLLAVHQGKALNDTLADLVCKGLGIAVPAVAEGNGDALIERRKEIIKKFVSGEWSTDLKNFEASRALDRQSGKDNASAWRV